jgi:hypothetical protein
MTSYSAGGFEYNCTAEGAIAGRFVPVTTAEPEAQAETAKAAMSTAITLSTYPSPHSSVTSAIAFPKPPNVQVERTA